MKKANNNTLLRHVVNELPNPFLVKDFNGKFVLTNKALAKLYNVENPDDMIGKDDGDYIPDKKQSEFFKHNVQEIMRKGETKVVYEDSIDVKTGEIRHYMSIKKPFKNEKNEDNILVIANDITEITRTQERLLKYEKILSVSSDFLSYLNKDGVFQAVNESYLNAFGLTREEIIGKSASALLGEEQYKKFAQPSFNKALGGEKASYESWYNFPISGKRYVQVTYYPYKPKNSDIIEGVVVQVYDLTERKVAEQKLQYIAHHDPLTGLPNRRMFSQTLLKAINRAKRTQKQIAVLFLDLDRFKIINDSLGHLIGDKILQHVASMLKTRVRMNDTVARSGGDEFLILLEEFTNTTDVANVCKSILKILAKPIIIDQHELYVTASIGVSLFPDDALSEDALILSADTAMYEAKKLGKNRFQLSNKRLRKQIYERFVLENSLRLALRAKELELFFQPFVDISSKKLLGAKVVLAWNHPTQGLIMADKFIPIAEDSGLIISIGNWYLEQACLQMKQWLDKGCDLLKISVNISANQLLQQTFVQTVKNALKSANLEAKFLELEITEAYLMQDKTEVLKTLTAIKKLGASIAIGDFGTGFSSLKYLQMLPISKIRIDKAFIKNTPHKKDDTAIVKTIIDLAKNLNMCVIAQGVSTQEQIQFLQENKCDYLQGPLFDEPVQKKNFEHMYFAKTISYM